MASSRDQLLCLLSTASLSLALACQGPTATPSKPAEPFIPTLSLRPVSVSLGVGATQTFQAELNIQKDARSSGGPVGWRVVESGGGTITTAGLYTAPAKPGVYHVQVRREDHKEVTASATVTVK